MPGAIPIACRLTRKAFTLVELLAVIAIVLVLFGLVSIAMNSVKGAGDITRVASEIKGLLDQGRSYAVANNTYVWVAFFEEGSATPGLAGTGRLVVAAVASKNGTLLSGTLNASNVVAIEKVSKCENVSLATNYASIPSADNLKRVTNLPNANLLGSSDYDSSLKLSWTVGATQYVFQKLIGFDPQGALRMQTEDVPAYLEIGLLPTAGSTIKLGNPAVIQVNGLTGATRLFRK